MKITKGALERRLLEQEKERKPGVPMQGLIVRPQPGETREEAMARTLELPEYAEHKACIAAGDHAPTACLYLLDGPLTLEETT